MILELLKDMGVTSKTLLTTYQPCVVGPNKFHLTGGLAVKLFVDDSGKLRGSLPLSLSVIDGPHKGLTSTVSEGLFPVDLPASVRDSIRVRMEYAAKTDFNLKGIEIGSMYLHAKFTINLDTTPTRILVPTADDSILLPIVSLTQAKPKTTGLPLGVLLTQHEPVPLDVVVGNTYTLLYKGKAITNVYFATSVGPFSLLDQVFDTQDTFVKSIWAQVEKEPVRISTGSRDIVALPKRNRHNELPLARAIYQLYTIMGGKGIPFPLYDNGFKDTPWRTAAIPEFLDEDIQPITYELGD